MKLGHILGFTLDEMSWFLLRVFDFEDGFRYNSSGDLIEAYGFITGTSWQHVETIKEKYKKLTQNILKSGVLEREADWTQSAGDSLKGKVEKWSVRPEEQEEQFMMWLKQRASCLDLPSRTASHIYQKLAVYIYEISEQNIRTPNRKTFIYKLKELCSQNSSYQKTVYEYLGEKNQSIIEKCLALGETFLRNERKQREQEEEEKREKKGSREQRQRRTA